jgi:hypothetical protein
MRSDLRAGTDPCDGTADLGADEMEALDAECVHQLAVVVNEAVEAPGKIPRHGR